MMERTLPSDDRAPTGVKSWQLWFSLAAGIVVWVVHLMIVYPLTSLTCEWDWFQYTVGSLTGLQIVQIAITLVAGAITFIAAVLAFRNRQHLMNNEALEVNRHRFMAALGFALNIMFTALIMIALIPILSLPQCG
jgi:NAD/NADP transhydrogenase beta subunit